MLKWHYCLHVNVKRLTTYQFSFERIFSDCLVCISHIVDLVSKFVNWPNYNEEQINYFKSKDKKMSKICPCSSKLIFLSDVLWGSFEIFIQRFVAAIIKILILILFDACAFDLLLEFNFKCTNLVFLSLCAWPQLQPH